MKIINPMNYVLGTSRRPVSHSNKPRMPSLDIIKGSMKINNSYLSNYMHIKPNVKPHYGKILQPIMKRKIGVNLNVKPRYERLLYYKALAMHPEKRLGQKLFLKRTKGVNMERFKDYDKDGVINGLDCRYLNPNKHGFFSKTNNWLRGKGYREEPDIGLETYNTQPKEDKLIELKQEYVPKEEPKPSIGSRIKEVAKRPFVATKEKLVEKGYRRDGELSLSRPISKATGYAFETSEERAKYKAEDYMAKVNKAKQKLSIERLQKLRNMGLEQEELNEVILKEVQDIEQKQRMRKPKQQSIRQKPILGKLRQPPKSQLDRFVSQANRPQALSNNSLINFMTSRPMGGSYATQGLIRYMRG